MITHLLVKVVSETGGALVTDEVTLGDTRLTKTRAHFRIALAGLPSGPTKLTLHIAGHPPMPFSVRVGSSVDFEGPAPRCCTVSRQRASSSAGSSDEFLVLRFELRGVHSEVVFFTGFDYDDGRRSYLRHAQRWRDDLYRGKTGISGRLEDMPRVIFDHTVVTIFDAVTGDRVRQIRGRRGWHEMDRVMQGSERPYLVTGKAAARARTAAEQERLLQEIRKQRGLNGGLSTMNVYSHLMALGRMAPGSVARFDYFGHAITVGPVVYNTFERAEYQPRGDLKDHRDPRDKDARGHKDFNGNAIDVAAFASAFAKDGTAQIWGCAYWQTLRDVIRRVVRAPDANTIVHRTDDTTLTRAQAEEAIRKILAGCYPQKLAKAIDRPVWATPVGIGTRFGGIGDKYQRVTVRAPVEYRFWADEHSLQAGPGGFVRYDP